MIIRTYQSEVVLNILKSNQVYYAHTNFKLQREYDGLINILGLTCKCPIFGYIKGKKYKTFGKATSSVLLTLNVPSQYVKLTEYSDWTDYMYFMAHFVRKTSDRFLSVQSDFYTQKNFDAIRASLKNQRPLKKYHVPQAILEEIRPQWLISYKIEPSGLFNRIKNLFR